MDKVVRTICLFRRNISEQDYKMLEDISIALKERGFTIQTKRICLPRYDQNIDDSELLQKDILLGLSAIPYSDLKENIDDFISSSNKNITLDLTSEDITKEHIDILFKIIAESPANTFTFTYGFNTPFSSPYFPSAIYKQDGFSVGLQPTDLAEHCGSLEEWFKLMQITWKELDGILKNFNGYLGIDSSIAPIFSGKGSLVNFVRRIYGHFDKSITTDIYTRISKFIKENNPRPIGLCGLMFPCLEDFELAEEYEKGNFSVERNIFLSLHSGLGIDTYPIAIDQNRGKVLEILKLVQSLSNKHHKPLSVRFVSDGKAKIGEKTDFKNQYLKDVVVREL